MFAIIADDAQLAAQLCCRLAEPGKYVAVFEQPRIQRPDREAEVTRCTNALARLKARIFIFAGLGGITAAALSVRVPERRTIHVRTIGEIGDFSLPSRDLHGDPLVWGRDRIGIGLLKALRERRNIVFIDTPSPDESISPRNDHLVVCEEGDDLAQVIAANYAFATGAGLHLIPHIAEERIDNILERFYGINEDRESSVSETLISLRNEMRALAGNIPVPAGGSITFITDGLPLGFAFGEVPSTHLFIYPDLGIAIAHGLAAAQPNSPGIRVVTLVNPDQLPAPEIETVVDLLKPSGVYLRGYEGRAADVTSVSDMIELFPYDLMIIATHCGDVSGHRWTYEFEDTEGIRRTLVVDIALGIGQSDVKGRLHVTEFMRFISLDGVDWTDRTAKAKLYVGKAIIDFMSRVGAGGDLKPVKKDFVSRVVGSAAMAMADANLIALPRSLAGQSTPIVINNACVSWHRLAKNFIFGGARAYLGTLIPVTPSEAHGVIERMLKKHAGKPLAVALWAAQRDVYGKALRHPYVHTGVFQQRLRPTPVDAPKHITSRLERGLREWRQMLADAGPNNLTWRRTATSRVRYFERELKGMRERWN